MPINPLTNLTNATQQVGSAIKPGGAQPGQVGGKDEDFGQMLMDVLKDVDSAQKQSQQAQNALMTGQQVDYHDLMIAMDKASVTMQLTLAVRNKLLDAYSEISKLQI